MNRFTTMNRHIKMMCQHMYQWKIEQNESNLRTWVRIDSALMSMIVHPILGGQTPTNTKYANTPPKKSYNKGTSAAFFAQRSDHSFIKPCESGKHLSPPWKISCGPFTILKLRGWQAGVAASDRVIGKCWKRLWRGTDWNLEGAGHNSKGCCGL